MTELEKIKSEIMALETSEAWELLRWLDEHLNDLWDRQIETDAKAGKLDKLYDQAMKDIAAGKVRPI
jgi:hypothetical protein